MLQKHLSRPVRLDPDYVCNCCNRLMYQKTVTEFSTVKYPKVQAKIMEAITIPSSSYHSTNERIWVCDSTLKRGLMPGQSKVNNLQVQNIPNELQDLNQLETRLICLRIPFMKMVALPTGKQRCIHGPCLLISANSEWVEQAATDNRTLWNALTAHHEDADDITPQGDPEDGHNANVTPDGDLYVPDHSTTISNSHGIPMPLSSMFSLI